MLISTSTLSETNPSGSLTLNLKLSVVAVCEVLVYITFAELNVFGKSSDSIWVSPSESVPLLARSIITKVKLSPSGSSPVNVIVLATFSVALIALLPFFSDAAGLSLTGVILIVTVAGSLSREPSLTLKVKLSLVAVFDELIYDTVAPFKETEPFVGWSTISKVKLSLSGSVPERSNCFETCSVTWTVWAVAVGASLTAVILIVTSTIAESNPSGSLTLNSKTSLVATSEVLTYETSVELNVFGKSPDSIWVSPSFSVPLFGSSWIIKVKLSPSGSVPARVIVLATFSVTCTVCAVAVGVSLTDVMFIETVDLSLSTIPSLTLNVKLSLVALSDVLV